MVGGRDQQSLFSFQVYPTVGPVPVSENMMYNCPDINMLHSSRSRPCKVWLLKTLLLAVRYEAERPIPVTLDKSVR